MLDKKTVQKVSRLARIQLNEDEVNMLSQQLSVVLENFEQIAQVDTSGVIALSTPTEIVPQFRADVATHLVSSEELLQNAPEKAGALFKVPPVV